MLGRNLLIDLDRSMQGASEWWIFHNGNRMFVGDLPDLQGQGINALGDPHRRIHSPLIFERHGKASRIGDDDGAFWDCGWRTDIGLLLDSCFIAVTTPASILSSSFIASSPCTPRVAMPALASRSWPRTVG